MRLDAALYVGPENAEFFNFRSVLSEYARSITVAPDWETGKKLIDTQTINLIVLNLRLENRERAAEIVQEIRARRMEVFAVGWPFQEIVAHNLWCIARGIDGTITVQQFRDAIGKIQTERRRRALLTALGISAVLGIVSTVLLSPSPIVKFLGIFWVATLAAEFACCVWSYSRKAV